MNSSAFRTINQRVLVVEDDARMLELVCKGLREVGHTPMPASDGDAGLELAMNFNFDSIILDIGLPGRDGYSIAHDIRAAKKDIPILMLTARDSEEDILRGFNFGADDYLTKPFSFRELLARLNVLGRVSPLHRVNTLTMDLTRLTVHRENAVIQLTRNEFLLLTVLHQHAGTAVERQVLLETVWGTEQTIPANALDVLINALRRKLDAPYHTKMILTVRGVGYRLQLIPRMPDSTDGRIDA